MFLFSHFVLTLFYCLMLTVFFSSILLVLRSQSNNFALQFRSNWREKSVNSVAAFEIFVNFIT